MFYSLKRITSGSFVIRGLKLMLYEIHIRSATVHEIVTHETSVPQADYTVGFLSFTRDSALR